MSAEPSRTVVFTGSYMDANLIHAILAEEDILSFLDNPNAALVGFQNPTGAFAVQVVVESEDVESAGAVVQAFLSKREAGE